jgi:hypothetical protein
MTIPDLRTLTLPQMAMAALALAVVIGVIGGMIGGSRGSRGTTFAVWMVAPFLIAICGLGVWLLLQFFNSIGPLF